MQKEKIQEISPKSTKEQIFAAYSQMLEQVNAKEVAPEEKQKQKTKQELVEKVYKHTSDNIFNDLSSLKLSLIKQVESLLESMMGEFEKLSEIREAIEIEQKHLEDVYQIKESSGSLAALIKAQAEQREKFQTEMQEKRDILEEDIASKTLEWTRKKEALEKDYKELQAELAKQRKREEEEYKYTQEIKVRKEQDEYATKKALLEKELADRRAEILIRESDIASKEALLQELQTKVDSFPEQIEKAICDARTVQQTQLEQQFNFAREIREKEASASAMLYNQKVESLESKINEQDKLIKDLTQKAHDAVQQVQLIACRALDTSSQRYIYTSTEEKVVPKNMS